MSSSLKYLNGYSPELKQQVQQMLDNNNLKEFIIKKYPTVHQINNDKDLRDAH